MGAFYGVNLFLAESSANYRRPGQPSEPTGNIKVAQDKAARAFGADQGILRHQWYIDIQQDGGAGVAGAGRHCAWLTAIATSRTTTAPSSLARCRSTSRRIR